MLIFVDDLAAACLDPLVFSLFSSTLILDSEERSRILLTVAASLSEFPSTILTSFPLIGAWAKTIVEKTNMSIEVQKVFMATHNTSDVHGSFDNQWQRGVLKYAVLLWIHDHVQL